MRFQAGIQVTLDFVLEGDADTISAVVENEDGEVVGSTANSTITIDNDGLNARLLISSTVNELGAEQIRGHRVVIVTYTSEAFPGQRSLEQDYALFAGSPLQVQVNSFQGYNEAVMTASDMTNLDSFAAASRDARIVALQDAWVGLCKLNYSFERENDQTRIHDTPGRDPWDMSLLSAEEFEGFPDRFKRALRRAQVAEANELLAGGGAAGKRLDGILSSTIGETSQMFRASKPVTYPVSPRALRELRGYVSFAVRVARGG